MPRHSRSRAWSSSARCNREIVSAINIHGGLAVGLSGEDANLIRAVPHGTGLGFVGDVEVLDTTIVTRLLGDGLIPVVATIGTDASGQAYNINADSVAGALAAALEAEKLVFLTDVEGLRTDSSDPATLATRLSVDELDSLIASGAVHSGMIPKVRACTSAVRAGVQRAHVLDGRTPHALLLELLTDQGVGTMVTLDAMPAQSDGPHQSTDRSALMRTYADPPVEFVKGRGSELFDADGRRYLDFLCGIAVTSLGHSHPEVARAVSEQARTLVHTSNLFATVPGAKVAATLDRLIGDGARAGGKVFFCNSGSEANECAIKLARKWAGNDRHVIVSALGSFHGRTYGSLSATGQLAKHKGFEPVVPGFVHVAYDDLGALETACASGGVAAVILEPIQGEAGVIEPSAGYLAGARRICDDRGILLIVDEVQTGLGRTGRWFGFNASGIAPDVVTVAKALGNGMPIGACWARSEVAAAFGPGDHGTTFGGQPLAAAAAAATLAVMQQIDAPSLAAKAGERLRAGARGPRRRRVRPRAGTVDRGAADLLERDRGRRRVVAARTRRERLPCGHLASRSAIHRHGRGDPRGPRNSRRGARMTRHVLEIDDLSCEELEAVLGLASEPPPKRGRRSRSQRAGSRDRAREAVAADAGVDGDSGRTARWARRGRPGCRGGDRRA